jgi:hypothetical protein
MHSLEHFRTRVEALQRQAELLRQQTHAREAHSHARAVQTPMCERRRRWDVRAVLLPVAIRLSVLGIALGSVTPAHADVIQCGDVLGPGGRFALEHNLECDFHAVTVRDGAILDLNGHIVACRPGRGIQCVILTGVGAQLLNGAVQGGFHESIVLEGTGGHTVRNVTSTLVDNNILIGVQSDHNQLINVMAQSAFNPAFNIAGNNNRLTDNIAQCFELAFGGCIRIHGDGNRLINNFATSTRAGGPQNGGFLITGNHNVLRRNRAIRNEGPGIVVTGTGNSVRHEAP